MDKLIALVYVFTFLGGSLLQNESQSTSQQDDTIPSRVHDLYTHWKKQQDKEQLGDELETYRLSVFYQNYLYIMKFYQNPKRSYDLAFNKFMDLTQEEFKAKFLTYDGTSPNIEDIEIKQKSSNVDWRMHGVISLSKEQNQFLNSAQISTLSSVEAIFKIKNGFSPDLSLQQLIDCQPNVANMDGIFQYIQSNGLSSNQQYPYTGIKDKCKFDSGPYKIIGYQVVIPGDCDTIEQGIVNQPIVVAVDATNWQFYKEGILDDCGHDLNLGALLVGSNPNYWVLQNSWGSDWGQQGYIKIKNGNTCGLCNAALFPII